MKQALIFDPYFDTLGGGERYSLSFASALKQAGFAVTLAWPDKRTLSEAAKRFNLETEYACDAAAFDIFRRGSLLAKWSLTRKFDVVFFVSDGSLPFLFGKKNYVHFQVPFKKVGGSKFINLFKIQLVNYFIYNSRFTQTVVQPQLPGSRSVVLYPPIDTTNFVPGKKENLILSVARFDSPSHAKRQDVLIKTFENLHQHHPEVKLILAGGIKGDLGKTYLKLLEEKAKNLPVKFVVNPDFSELKGLYAKALIFWHAAGYGIDEKEEPEKVEHFGMTTVEAMAAGAIPIVIDKGGQREIITDESGFLCQSPEEIVSRTISLLASKRNQELMSQEARDRAKDFSLTSFISEVESIIIAK